MSSGAGRGLHLRAWSEVPADVRQRLRAISRATGRRRRLQLPVARRGMPNGTALSCCTARAVKARSLYSPCAVVGLARVSLLSPRVSVRVSDGRTSHARGAGAGALRGRTSEKTSSPSSMSIVERLSNMKIEMSKKVCCNFRRSRYRLILLIRIVLPAACASSLIITSVLTACCACACLCGVRDPGNPCALWLSHMHAPRSTPSPPQSHLRQYASGHMWERSGRGVTHNTNRRFGTGPEQARQRQPVCACACGQLSEAVCVVRERRCGRGGGSH